MWREWLVVAILCRAAMAAPDESFVAGAAASGLTYIPTAHGLAAIDVRDGSVAWTRDVTLVAAGASTALVWRPAGGELELIDRHGKIVAHSDPITEARGGYIGVDASTPTTVDVLWMQTEGHSGGMPRPPGPTTWGVVRFDLRSGHTTRIDGGKTAPGNSPPLRHPSPPPQPLPPKLADDKVMAAPVRLRDGTIVMLRKQTGSILLYRWTDATQPGAPTTIATEAADHRVVLAGASDDGILLWDCHGDDCLYELYASDGNKLTETKSSRVWALGDAVLTIRTDDPAKIRIERLDVRGAAMWSRVLDAVPPPPPPPP
jgi:outer membrane protein assembly factor BamB